MSTEAVNASTDAESDWEYEYESDEYEVKLLSMRYVPRLIL